MNAIFFISLLALALSGCFVTGKPGGGMEIIPILPAVVEVDMDSHYEYNGYHYYYDHDRWYYSNSMGGSRRELPRNRWPREVRHGNGNPHR